MSKAAERNARAKQEQHAKISDLDQIFQEQMGKIHSFVRAKGVADPSVEEGGGTNTANAGGGISQASDYVRRMQRDAERK